MSDEIKPGLYDKYLYKDGKKFIGQFIRSKDQIYKSIPNFKRKEKFQYISTFNNLKKSVKKPLKLNTEVPTDEFLIEDEYIPLGKNIRINFEEITINKLVLNSLNKNKYIVLKISGGLYYDKETKFVCKDTNEEIISLSIKNAEKYYNAKTVELLENEIFKTGKYIIVIEPNYGIFEPSKEDLDEIKINSPNEIILVKNEDELYYVLDKNRNPSAENYKQLGNFMMRNNMYEKAIYYYTLAIKINKNNNDDNLDLILHSNLAEAYNRYGYYSKVIQCTDYSLNKVRFYYVSSDFYFWRIWLFLIKIYTTFWNYNYRVFNQMINSMFGIKALFKFELYTDLYIHKLKERVQEKEKKIGDKLRIDKAEYFMKIKNEMKKSLKEFDNNIYRNNISLEEKKLDNSY